MNKLSEKLDEIFLKALMFVAYLIWAIKEDCVALFKWVSKK